MVWLGTALQDIHQSCADRESDSVARRTGGRRSAADRWSPPTSTCISCLLECQPVGMISRLARRCRFSLQASSAMAWLGILGLCVATGCVRPYGRRPKLTDALRLETSIRPTDLQSATEVRGRFFLRNIAASAIELCEVDSGVSVAAITDRGLFPLIGHGMPSDAAPLCYRLRPSEAKEFTEYFKWSPTMGFTQLQGFIRISSRRGGDTASLKSDPVSVTQP